jgi:hypothetical protein
VLLKVSHEYLLNVVHLVDLGAPFIELIRQNVDNAVTVGVALVIVYAHFTKVAVMLHAEVSGVVHIVESITVRR